MVDPDGKITIGGDDKGAGGKLTTPGGNKLDVPGDTTITPDGKVTIGEGGGKITYQDGSGRELPEGLIILLEDKVPLGFLIISLPFVDVNPNDWYFDAVAYVYFEGFFSGTSPTTFSPNLPITRGMVVTVLGRLAGIDAANYSGGSFDDVDTEMYYAPYIKWAAELGIVKGIGENKFAPDANVIRQDLAVILNNYAEKMGLTLKQTLQNVVFVDSGDIADYAADEVANMARVGVIFGRPGNVFDPKANATRAEVAAVLHRFVAALQ